MAKENYPKLKRVNLIIYENILETSKKFFQIEAKSIEELVDKYIKLEPIPERSYSIVRTYYSDNTYAEYECEDKKALFICFWHHLL